MKKRLGVLLVLVLALAIWCGVASAGKTNSYFEGENGEKIFIYATGDWQYYFMNGEAYLYRYTGTSSSIVRHSRIRWICPKQIQPMALIPPKDSTAVS